MTELDCEKGVVNGDPKIQKDAKSISIFRRTLPQVLATSAKNLILLDLGMTMAFPTLVIPALLHANNSLSFDESLASWFGSIAFICQPIGSLISGTVLEPLGRKRSMLLVNVPHLIGWYMFYASLSLPVLFVAAIMMGLGVGFMEAPVITYVGEISEPRLRGILTSYSGIFVTLGMVVEFLLGTLYGWRTAALISAFVPIITFIAISQVPETPMWLLSKGRVEEAEKSLCWLRGWVPATEVQKELADLTRYSNASKLILKDKKPKPTADGVIEKGNGAVCISPPPVAYSNPVSLEDETVAASVNGVAVDRRPDVVECTSEAKANESRPKDVEPMQIVCNEADSQAADPPPLQRKPTMKELTRDMLRPQMLKPFSLVIAFFVFHNGSGMPAMRPYMVKVFEELRFPVDAHWATVITSCIAFLGVIVCTGFVKLVGKRRLTLASLSGCAICLLGLCLWTLFNENTGDKSPSWWPFIFFIFLTFSFSFGLAPVPWMILSEVFPFRGRGFASGVAAAISYIMGFITSKTFLDLQAHLGLSGVFSLYGTITIIGIVYVYMKLPETEGRSLEDIEKLYNKKSKKNIK